MALLKSKKFIMAIAGVIGVIVAHYYPAGETIVLEIAGIVSAYLIGQGIADHGKEAAKVTLGK